VEADKAIEMVIALLSESDSRAVERERPSAAGAITGLTLSTCKDQSRAMTTD